MGDRCLRSVAAKLRTDAMDEALEVRLEPKVRGLVVVSSGRSSNRTRLFVVVIALDAGIVVIFFSLSNDRQLRSNLS